MCKYLHEFCCHSYYLVSHKLFIVSVPALHPTFVCEWLFTSKYYRLPPSAVYFTGSGVAVPNFTTDYFALTRLAFCIIIISIVKNSLIRSEFLHNYPKPLIINPPTNLSSSWSLKKFFSNGCDRASGIDQSSWIVNSISQCFFGKTNRNESIILCVFWKGRFYLWRL